MSLDRLADAGVESVVVNVHHLADILERHLAPRQRPNIVISDERGELLGTGGGVAKALPQLGDAPFFHVNSDTVWIDGVTPNLDAPRRSLRSRPRWTSCSCSRRPPTSIGYNGRGDFAMAPDGRLAPARRARGGPLRLCGRGDPLADAVRRCAEGRVLAHPPFRPRRRDGPAVRPAARRRVDACRHARSDRGRRSRDLAARRRSAVIPSRRPAANAEIR